MGTAARGPAQPRTSAPERPARGLPAPGEFETERRPTRRARAPRRSRTSARAGNARAAARSRSRPRTRRSLTIGRASLATSLAASGCAPATRRSAPTSFPPARNGRNATSNPLLEGEARPPLADLADEDDPGSFPDAGAAGAAGAARPDGRADAAAAATPERERAHESSRPPSSPIDELETDFEDFAADVEPVEVLRPRPRSGRRSPGRSRRSRPGGARGGPGAKRFDDDEFAGDELADVPAVAGRGRNRPRARTGDPPGNRGDRGARARDGPARPGRRPRPGAATSRPEAGDPAAAAGLLKPPIQEIFRRGDEVLVQVIKESIGTKGPTLSTYISIPGRYLVLMPGLNRVGVSRKIVDEGQRRKLREIMHELNPPKGLGFIVRTAGLERTKRELARDLAYLLRLWKVILRRIKKSKAPTPIYQESDMIIRTIRDIFNSEIDTIWIDEPSAFERAQDFLKVVMPRFVNRLKLYDEKVPLFHKYGIEDEIAKIQRRHVPLPEGGSIVIDQTEALVAIDVNSGNFRVEDDAERTAYEMNLRAAKEIARQLRLRDLGGVIVNDFIDMREERHRRGVERALREAIKRDRARTKVLRMSAFGLIEMTRQRIRPSLKRSIYEDCHSLQRRRGRQDGREHGHRRHAAPGPGHAPRGDPPDRDLRPSQRGRLPEQPQTQGDRPARIRVQHDDPDRLRAELAGGTPEDRVLRRQRQRGPAAPAAGLDPQTWALTVLDRSPRGRVNARCQPPTGRRATIDLPRPLRLDHPSPSTHGNRAMTFQPAAGYPLHRPRRLRGHPRLRDLVCETRLAVDDLIYPLFVYHGKNLRREIPSMPGQYQLSLDRLGEAVAEASELGIPAILLFGIPEHKDARGSAAAARRRDRSGGDPGRQAGRARISW